MLVTLENNWSNWIDHARTGSWTRSRIRNQYTSRPGPDQQGDVDRMIPSRFSGWNNVGISQYNQYVTTIQGLRQHRALIELNYIELWKILVNRGRTSRKKNRTARPSVVPASHNLYAHENPTTIDNIYDDVPNITEI